MHILIDINHPGQVHLFKHPVWEWQKLGHEVLIVAREKDVTVELLEAYKLPFVKGTSRRPGLLNLGLELIRKTALLVKIARRFKPDVFVSLGSPPAAWASVITRKPHITFTDTEHSIEQYWLYAPVTPVIYTPESFNRELGKKQLRYAGYHELAYLHPKRFTPNLEVLQGLGLEDKPFFVVRLVSFEATHDVGQVGISQTEAEELVRILQSNGEIILSSERDKGLKSFNRQFEIAPEHIHDLLAFATMYIGEGGTMATEAAVLGTPSIYISPLSSGNWEELASRYGLVHEYRKLEEAVPRIKELLAKADLKQEWEKKRNKMLEEKIDVTDFIVKAVTEFDV
ncbi:MAG: DUF354 domain-containing protein [Chloroflexi bacterium]|nr:MAG: DUF354 domain-containing protein [Chloroflexota bacterium]MBL1193111.1 DUF354 domain-containing protein [Chloroflexota bacterium]NOH10403.1 DUF354 domain-containing protein [Chloroflexota bacterium]